MFKQCFLLILVLVSFSSQAVVVGWPSNRSGFITSKIEGNTFFHSTVNNWDPKNKSRFVEYKVSVSKSGFYHLKAKVLALNGTTDSFYVVVNKRFPMLWSIPKSPRPALRTIDRKMYLKSGENKVTFYARENYTKVADVHADFFSDVKPSYSESFNNGMPKGVLDRRVNRDGLWVTNWKSLKVKYKPSEVGSPRLLWSKPVNKANEYTLTYKVKFNDGFDFARGGKLHGMGPDNPTSGCRPRTDVGWSNRLMFGTGGKAFLYLYHQNRPRACGEGRSSGNDFRFKTGRWYTISIYTKLNSSADKSDGVAKLYINGTQLVEVKDIKFRNSTSSASMISKFNFSTFFGGNDPSYAPSKEVSAYFDDIQMVEGDYPR